MLVILTLGILSSCSEEEAVTRQTTAPVLPPINTFLIDTTSFAVASNSGRRQAGEYSVSAHSYVNYVGWQAALTLYLSEPAIAFRESFNHEAHYVAEEGRWRWSYDVRAWDQTYQVTLYGKKAATHSVWEMYVSQSGGFQDLLWFSGTAALDGSGGNWNVNVDPENPRAALAIEWKKSNGKIPYVKYISVDQQSNAYQNYIEYGMLPEGDFNVYYHIYSSSEDNLLKIEYNTETRKGRASDAKKFGDQEWKCWNSDYQNVSCQ